MGRLGNFEKNSGAGLSPAIWNQLSRDIFSNPMHGHVVGLTKPPLIAATAELGQGEYRVFASTGGVGTSDDAVASIGGAIAITDATDDEGISFGSATQPFQLTKGGRPFAFEARIKLATIADTKFGLLIGLQDNTALTVVSPIKADGTLEQVNYCGFHRLEGDGDYWNTVYGANGVAGVTVKSDAQVIVADTYQKLGMVAKDGTLTFYVNGAPLADTKTLPDATGTDFPADILMGTCCAFLAAAATAGAATVQWMIAAQEIDV